MVESINAIPAMDEEGLACFKEALRHSHCYLEYGCGGSTVYACNIAKVKAVISVESDQRWAEKIRASLDNSSSNLFIEHCDVGEVVEWGHPKNNDRVSDFWKYMSAPWAIAEKKNSSPTWC